MKKKGKYLRYILVLFPVLFLSSCNMDSLGDDLSSSIEAKLIPNIWAFLVQFIAFIILILIVIKFAYKPVKKYLDKRSELLTSEREDAKNMKEKAQENLLESDKKLAEVRQNATNIINDAKTKALNERENILQNANEEARKIKENAFKSIEEEKLKAKSELKEEIVDVAFSATSKLLEREVNDKDNKKIVDDFIKDLDKKTK